MSVQYKLKLTEAECVDALGNLANVVTKLHWSYEATDGVFTTAMQGNTALPDPAPEAFVAFELLTKEQVEAWLLANIEPTLLPFCETKMLEWLAAQHNSKPVRRALPWTQETAQ
jgi:hypothetical protein